MTHSPATLRIMIVAGEASGDLYGAALMRELRRLHQGEISFRGIGGDAMLAAGQEQLCHVDQTALIGFWEVFKHLRFFVRLMRRMTRELEVWQPHLLLTIDYPGFNLRLAARAHKRHIRTSHYISPQVWVWHRSRIYSIARTIDQLITIFPFEPACFDPTPLRPVYAGHPLVDQALETLARPEATLPWGTGHRIALLPGSRRNEITMLLPGLIAAALLLEERLGPCSFIIPAASQRMRRLIETSLAALPRQPQHLQLIDGQARETLRQAAAAAIASGTATLEASLMRCPAVLVYRTSWLNYHLMRFILRKHRFVGLANIVCDRSVMPELLQADFTPAVLADHLTAYLTDAAVRQQALADLDEVNVRLGSGGAAAKAAELIIKPLHNPA